MWLRDLGLAPRGFRGTRIALHGAQEKAMSSNPGWSWSLRLVLVLAVATAIWASAATFALGAMAQRARVSALSLSAPPASHR
jgi:hypothetical protein